MAIRGLVIGKFMPVHNGHADDPGHKPTLHGCRPPLWCAPVPPSLPASRFPVSHLSVGANLNKSSRQSPFSDPQSCLHIYIWSIRLVAPARVEALAAWVDGTTDGTARGTAADSETEVLNWLPASKVALSGRSARAERTWRSPPPRCTRRLITGQAHGMASSRRSG